MQKKHWETNWSTTAGPFRGDPPRPLIPIDTVIDDVVMTLCPLLSATQCRRGFTQGE